MYKSLTLAAGLCAIALAVPQADNSKMNKRDRSAQAMTADQQGESKADRDTTQKIRKALTDDEALSTYAKNIKVITKDGKVILRGPVRTEEEKKKVEMLAGDSAGGAANITSHLEIAPKK